MPSPSEIYGDLYLPPASAEDAAAPPVPPCRDADPTVAPEPPLTLESIQQTVFEPSCAYSACHGRSGAAGLILTGGGLRERLLTHPERPLAGMPLVSPGDPERSWLYQKIAKCTPMGAAGASTHMPLNAPFLLDDALVAKVRGWIEAGAR